MISSVDWSNAHGLKMHEEANFVVEGYVVILRSVAVCPQLHECEGKWHAIQK